MFIDIEKTHAFIQEDILSNLEDVFNRYTHYTTKHRGDLLNDVNVGIFLGDGNIPTVQIFVRNKTGCIRTHITFSRDCRNINNITILNNIRYDRQ